MPDPLWTAITQAIHQATRDPCELGSLRSVAGGSINQAYVLTTPSGSSYFVKCHRGILATEMFAAEMAGLQELKKAEAMRIPAPIVTGLAGETAFLVLEHISLGSPTDKTAQTLGIQLAALHRYHAGRYGWDRTNTIGSTPQLNPWSDDWVSFYRDHRLGYQVKLARRKGLGGTWIPMAEQVMAGLKTFFEDYTPAPSILHGDLWGGNWGSDDQGDPVIFDPAVYYGDRETDLAMTELFGGFPPTFYRAYQATYPLDPGYEQRKPLYQLYHLLNHLNLFGGSYLSGVQGSLRSCLAYLS